MTADGRAADVFERYALDYCCHGDRTLEEACDAVGVDPALVLGELEVVGVAPAATSASAWASLGIVELVDHIVDVHHAYLRAELPALDALARRVRDVHGARHPELDEVVGLVASLRAELEPHLLKEERVLFPALRAMVLDGRDDFPFGTVDRPIRVMLGEHDRAGELLASLRAASAGFVPPSDGCASYRSLYERLAALELDTHLHVLKENHRLFPLALALLAADRRHAC